MTLREIMTRTKQLIMLGFVFLCLSGCAVNFTRIGVPPTPSESEVYIVPQAGNGINLAQSRRSDTSPSRIPPVPLYAVVPDSYVVSQVFNRNLDQDIAIEQVVLYRDTRDGDYIQILIVDYDRRRDSYIRAWEGVSAAQNTVGTTVDFFDLTGDSSPEILIYGRDQYETFTLDIFNVEFASEEAIISLVNIGSFYSESAIGIGSGIFPQIIIEEAILSDNEALLADNIDEQFQLRAYQWSPNTNRFYRSILPIAASPEINQQFFQQLIHTPVDNLLQRVTGNWMAEDSVDTVFLIIDNDNELVNLQIDQRQVVFRWRNPFKTITGGFPTIHLTLLNEQISSLIRQANITLLANDEIRLSIQGEPALNRSYRRITAAQTATENPHLTHTEIELTGWYEGIWREGRIAIYFYENSYLIEHPTFGREEQRRGVFSTYTLDMPILELVELDSNRLVRTHQQYSIHYQQQYEDNQLVRALELQPITIHYRGYRPLDEPALQLIQVVNVRR